MAKSPIMRGWLIFKEWRAYKRARKLKRSSGHLDPSARSAEFHRLKTRRR